MMQNYIDEAEKYLLHTYNRYQVVFDHGDGVKLYDTDGKEYLDFVSGIGVFALGYNNKEFNDAIKAQVDKILHTSNYYYNVPAIEAAKAVCAESQRKTVPLQPLLFPIRGNRGRNRRLPLSNINPLKMV